MYSMLNLLNPQVEQLHFKSRLTLHKFSFHDKSQDAFASLP